MYECSSWCLFQDGLLDDNQTGLRPYMYLYSEKLLISGFEWIEIPVWDNMQHSSNLKSRETQLSQIPYQSINLTTVVGTNTVCVQSNST